ncbi:flippase-like domain-containing protein [Candidatus Woesearchaeota archaeon]|nr:flippase-like domain-containing protein [Candidatus Woesearchaeota archaeon]
MKKVFFLPIPLMLGLVLFIIIVGAAGLENIISAFREFSLSYLAAFLAVSFVINMLSVYKWQLILKGQGHNVGIHKLFTYKLSAFSVSYIMPFSRLMGEPIRALLLKRHGISTAKAVSYVFLDKSLDMVMDTIMAGIVIVILLLGFGLPEAARNILLILLAVIAAAIGLFCFVAVSGPMTFLSRVFPGKLLNHFRERLVEIDSIFGYFLRRRKATLAKLMAITLLQWVLIAVEFKLATMIIGYNAKPAEVLMMMLAAGLSTVAPIPAGLGVLEAGMFSVFSMIGAGAHTGIVLSLLIRAKDLIWVFVGFVFLSHEGVNTLQAIRAERKYRKLR